ncbi:zinc finger protein 142 [Mixophyes fleayi]|uniref:zinc finger protein 142 n=1 Tax=Mixophyes fleayi TaxID=3061075 RepID=UPI003F4DE749
MSEEELGSLCDWTRNSYEQFVPQTIDAENQMEDTVKETIPGESAVDSSCLQNGETSQINAVSLSADGQPALGTSEVDCRNNTVNSDHVSAFPDSSMMLQDICGQLVDSETTEYPRVSNIIIGDQVFLGQDENSTEDVKKDALFCPICHKEFKTPTELKEHFKSHPSPPPDLQCWQGGCTYTAQNFKRFQSHMRREHRLTAVTCSHRTCRLLFPSREEMSRHFRNHFAFHCNHCDFVSSNTKVFCQHKKSHSRQGQTSESRQTSPLKFLTADPAKESFGQNRRQSNEEVDSRSVLACRKRRKTSTRKEESKNPENSSVEENGRDRVLEKTAKRPQVVRTGKNKDGALKDVGAVENGKEHLFKTHMCPECKRCFKKRTHLADHLHLHFPDPNLQCPNCRKFFTSRNKLKIHMMREAGEKVHRCSLCDYSSVEKNALNRHMASIHEGVSNFYSDTYSCPVCQETFKLSQALKDHMKGHKTEQKMMLCFQQGCNQAVSDRKEFLRHLKELHDIQAVECRYHACSMLFRSREEMEQHRKNHYAFHCQECDFVCSNKHVFRKHKKRGHAGTEELVCRFCPYKSFNPVEYADHVGKMHANEKIHRCGDCDFATAHKRVLMRHMLLHTGEKPHKCSQCDFVCRDISYLSKHMLTHSTDKNYMCTECGYITKWKHYLNVHMRKHSGDLRYHCNQCSYRCHRADQLSSHKLRHQGKTLICEICGFGCKRKSELQKHMQAKHSQSSQIPMYQCQHCSYQTKYKQTLRNHENGKHTKHREFRCALCSFRTFSNTSLFFHKRKSHGYVPGDQEWLEKYASKQQEINQADLLFPYKVEGAAQMKPPSSGDEPAQNGNPEELDGQVQKNVNDQTSECLQVKDLTESAGDPDISVTEESLLAAITLEPVETCSIEMEGFPVRLELSASNELLAKESAVETLVNCEGSLPIRAEILCFSESLTIEDHVNCGQDYEEEADPHMDDQEKIENCLTVQYNQEPILCELTGKCDELPIHVNANIELQPGDIPVEVQESWADVVEGGVQLTIVCESSGLSESNIQEIETSTVSLDQEDESSRPESILKALRKQDKEQAETLVLEGRVQMLVVQSNSQVYRCEKCSYITKKKGCIDQHSKSGCHVRKSSLVCEECGAVFKQQRGLNTHILKKCPVILKKKRASLKATTSAESLGQDSERHLEDNPVNTVSAEEVIPASQDSNMPRNCLEVAEQLSPCQAFAQEQFKENIPDRILDNEEMETTLSLVPSEDHRSPDLVSVENQKYRFEEGKFRCMFCSYSCTRECTISCHVNENCRELRMVPCALCPSVLRSVAALRKHRREKHKGPESGRGDGHVSESSIDEESQNPEDDQGNNRDLCETVNKFLGTCRLSCPTCPFTCTQERAMRTHKKKGCLKAGELQCSLCSFRCMSTAALKRHRELHQKYSRSRAQLQCKQCDFTCKQPRCMKQHERIRHEGVKPHQCRYCDFSTTRRYRLEAHESLHTGVGRIACNSCSRTFGTNSKLRLHQRRVHEKKPTHFCKLCDYSGYSQNDIARHMGSCHSGEPAFPCAVCQATFSSEAALKQHSLRKHQEKATHECSQCSFSCHSQATLRCHTQKQHLQLECSICKETFSRRQDMEEHRKCHFSHRCQQCQYAAKDRQQLVNHYAEQHETSALPDAEGEEVPLHCPFCTFSCRHQLVYDHHVKGHGATRVYKCSDCEYSTRNKQKITWHSRIHTGEKPYKCHLCTYACADPSRLKYHMRIHKDEKNYLCPECGYKCKWVNQLKYHMTKHTGLKPYHCEECDYCTNRADALRVHRETRHREVRSFICEQCGKAFKTRFLLKTHLKKHSEEKPYVCTVCQRGFRWPAGLRHHYLTHTNQQPFFCQHCSYRAKQKFQVVKHIQRHHPNDQDITKGVGKEPYLFSIQGHDTLLQPIAECEKETLSV